MYEGTKAEGFVVVKKSIVQIQAFKKQNALNYQNKK